MQICDFLLFDVILRVLTDWKIVSCWSSSPRGFWSTCSERTSNSFTLVFFAWLGLSLRGSLEKPQESSKKATQPSSSSTYNVIPAMCTINFTKRSIPWLQRATFRRQIVGLFWGYSVNLCKFWRGSKRQRNEKTKLIEFYQFLTPERHSTNVILHHKPSSCQKEESVVAPKVLRFSPALPLIGVSWSWLILVHITILNRW